MLAALCLALAVAPSLSLQPSPLAPSRFFLDSADRATLDELLPTGLFYGVTCNPSILAKDGVKCDYESVAKLAHHAIDQGSHEVMIQAWGGTVERFEESAFGVLGAVQRDADKVVIKLPLTRDGIVAGRLLLAEGVKVCMTACYAKHQALTAGALGATYLAPYFGRMTDGGKDGLAECLAMESTLRQMRAPTRLLVASLRDVQALFDVSAVGSDATFSPAVARALLSYGETEAAAAVFEQAAAANS
ncbi:hypothetical protein M885DRAFT_506326 [Pelagophyceae sp. CCMP2097]|nr:hypothetical protein M885DRAFT_506326 [Pelagophyceae sp. CCMP2097]